MLAAIRKLARGQATLAGIDTAPFLLAAAGVLDGHRATCHWESLPGFREEYPQVQATQSLYEIDRGRITCAGGSAAIDMMLAIIEGLLGRALAVTVADQLLHFRMADDRAQARAPARVRHGTEDPRLLSIIAAMEGSTEEVLPAAAVAAIGGLSHGVTTAQDLNASLIRRRRSSRRRACCRPGHAGKRHRPSA